MNSIESKIDYWFNQTSSQFISEGKQWYFSANEWSKSLAQLHNIDQKKVVGLTACFSPMKEWSLNKKLVEEYLLCQDCGHFGGQLKKAQLIYNRLATDEYIMTVLGGLKTSSFYHNIMYPEFSTCLTIDFRIWKYFKDDKWNHITPKRYMEMTNVFYIKSREYQLSIPSLQAILWLTCKEYGKYGNNRIRTG